MHPRRASPEFYHQLASNFVHAFPVSLARSDIFKALFSRPQQQGTIEPMKIQLFCLGAIFVIATSYADPKVYRFVDDQGMVVYSDRAPQKVQQGAQQEISLPAAPTEAAVKAAEERESRLKAEAEKMANDRKERVRAAQAKTKEAEKKPEGKIVEGSPGQAPTINPPVNASP